MKRTTAILLILWAAFSSTSFSQYVPNQAELDAYIKEGFEEAKRVAERTLGDRQRRAKDLQSKAVELSAEIAILRQSALFNPSMKQDWAQIGGNVVFKSKKTKAAYVKNKTDSLEALQEQINIVLSGFAKWSAPEISIQTSVDGQIGHLPGNVKTSEADGNLLIKTLNVRGGKEVVICVERGEQGRNPSIVIRKGTKDYIGADGKQRTVPMFLAVSSEPIETEIRNKIPLNLRKPCDFKRPDPNSPQAFRKWTMRDGTTHEAIFEPDKGYSIGEGVLRLRSGHGVTVALYELSEADCIAAANTFTGLNSEINSSFRVWTYKGKKVLAKAVRLITHQSIEIYFYTPYFGGFPDNDSGGNMSLSSFSKEDIEYIKSLPEYKVKFPNGK